MEGAVWIDCAQDTVSRVTGRAGEESEREKGTRALKRKGSRAREVVLHFHLPLLLSCQEERGEGKA